MSELNHRIQESVWAYPRPPALVCTTLKLKVILRTRTDEVVLATTKDSYRVLETSHPPTYYFPTRDIEMTYLRESQKSSMCEWKGRASYYDLIDPRSSSTSPHNLASAKAWCYHQPTADFELIRDYVAFYACETLRCFVEDEEVEPQAGDFYGGWKTLEITGGERGMKGGPGTYGW